MEEEGRRCNGSDRVCLIYTHSVGLSLLLLLVMPAYFVSSSETAFCLLALPGAAAVAALLLTMYCCFCFCPAAAVLPCCCCCCTSLWLVSLSDWLLPWPVMHLFLLPHHQPPVSPLLYPHLCCAYCFVEHTLTSHSVLLFSHLITPLSELLLGPHLSLSLPLLRTYPHTSIYTASSPNPCLP